MALDLMEQHLLLPVIDLFHRLQNLGMIAQASGQNAPVPEHPWEAGTAITYTG